MTCIKEDVAEQDKSIQRALADSCRHHHHRKMMDDKEKKKKKV